jgi:hypothetical protein
MKTRTTASVLSGLLCLLAASCSSPVSGPDAIPLKQLVTTQQDDPAAPPSMIQSCDACCREEKQKAARQQPRVSRKQIRTTMQSAHHGQTSVTWDIVNVKMSACALTCYSFGHWKYTAQNESGQDTTLSGETLTVWKLQSNGSWKNIMEENRFVYPSKMVSS